MKALILVALAGLPALATPPPVDFQRDVRPILSRKCFPCHGLDDGARKANLRLDSFDAATGHSGGYPGIVPGKASASRVIARVSAEKNAMPPSGDRLKPDEIAMLRRWIDEGAKYTSHWSFAKPVRPAPPAVKNAKWVRNPIDNFILAKLEQEKLKPSSEADKKTLARRVALALTGLPPQPPMLDGYLKDKSPAAYEHLVDKLLATPAYGERWARVWLDLARYADTQGYEKDNRRTIWPYRDWVIRAYNANAPFDEFTRKQLAGDLLPKATLDDQIATGFHRNTMTNTEGGTDREEFRDLAVKDRVATTGQVWMGLTFGCAQCHTHKYDPISHKEFYQIYAFLNQTEDADRANDTPTIKAADWNGAPVTTLVMKELDKPKQRRTRIHERGVFLNPGADVQPAVLSSLHPMPANAPANRLGLAEWLLSPENPLTARVQVNRLWARMFGRGIVETEEDFGTQGSLPSNQPLLDWLAVEFREKGWDQKALLKTIVMSNTYRQSSNITDAEYKKDPLNRMYARGPRFRLEAEMVRDQALSVSGLLSAKMYGPPVMPWQPEGLWQVIYNADRWIVSEGEDRYRRGLYTFARRTSPYPALAMFDAPTGEVCTMRRIRTNTPLQALAGLNDPAQMEAAWAMSKKLSERPPDASATAERLLRAVLVRDPSKAEVRRVVKLWQDASADLRAHPDEAKRLIAYPTTIYEDTRRIHLVEDSRAKSAAWRYSTEEAAPKGWNGLSFDDSGWNSGPGQFGNIGTVNKTEARLKLATPWDTERIRMRTEFEVPAEGLENLKLEIFSQVQFDVFINGVLATSQHLERRGYYEYDVQAPALAALRPGRNVIAVEAVRNDTREKGQFLDVCLAAIRKITLPELGKGDVERAAWMVTANTVLNLDEALTLR